ncbi:MAG: hypothetical protein ACO23N_06735 [Opitutales bacterium]
MRLRIALPALLAFALLHAQGFEDPASPSAPSPATRQPAKPGEPDPAAARLRSISYFFIDVRTSENRPDDADLRNELRDLAELELRRAGVTPKELPALNPDASTPQLMIEVRFDRGLGRYAAQVSLSVRDDATIRRNSQPIVAETYRSERQSAGTSDSLLTRDIKAKAREAIVEMLELMSKPRTTTR